MNHESESQADVLEDVSRTPSGGSMFEFTTDGTFSVLKDLEKCLFFLLR